MTKEQILSNYLNETIEKLKNSTEETIPEEFKNDHFELSVSMKHGSGTNLTAGICRCPDENGDFQYMDCRDCPK